MAWYRPLQRTDGRWDYVCTNSSGTFPIGYCMFSGDAPFYSKSFAELGPIVRQIYRDEAHWEAEKDKRAASLHRYHNGGHATPEEAIACYRQYEVLEHSTRGEDQSAQEKCGICLEWTQGRVLVGSEFPRDYPICDGCYSNDNVLKLHLAKWTGRNTHEAA
jgi:hypothetical protein